LRCHHGRPRISRLMAGVSLAKATSASVPPHGGGRVKANAVSDIGKRKRAVEATRL
jgi:hypothetical protein